MNRRYTRRGLLGMGAALGLSALLARGARGQDEPPADSRFYPAELVVIPPTPETTGFKIAQMLMVGFHGTRLSLSSPIFESIRNWRIGGVLLFDHPNSAVGNIESPTQLKDLTAALRELSPVPLLIAVDQEGGSVARLKPRNGFPAFPSQERLGRLNDTAATRRNATATAAILAEHGINMNLAPVVDLNTNPSNPVIGSLGRSFSADPQVVAAHSFEVLAAHSEKRVVCALKHFPGHGSSRADSHAGFVDVTNTWSRTELEPYRKIMGWGMCQAIMTAHIYNAHLDRDLPATLSQRTITGLLREEMGYEGVVMTDDLQMGAIARYYSFEQAIELALKAGVDIITLASDVHYGPNTVERAIKAIRSLLERGEITLDRIDQSYRRIKRLKSMLW